MEQLSPSQQKCCDEVLKYSRQGQIVFIAGSHGSGKSRVLRSVATKLQGELITMRQFMEWQRDAHPLRLEETLEWLLTHHLAQSDIVLFDDMHRLLSTMSYRYYPRHGYVDAALADIPNIIESENKLFIAVCNSAPPSPLRGGIRAKMPHFTEKDYAFILNHCLGNGHQIDTEKLYEATSNLSGYQLRSLATLITAEHVTDTESVIRMLGASQVSANQKDDEE